MKSIKNLAVLTAATLALVATGCQSKHKTKTETAKAESRTERHVDQVEDSTTEAAEGVAEMGRDIDREARSMEKDMEEETASARDELEDAFAEGEKNAEETADEAAKDTVAGVDEAGDDVADTAKKAEKDTKATAKKAERDVQAGAEALDGKKVGAEVQKIDKEKRVVVFSIKDSADEIQLQAGKELTVNFSEMAALTGLTEEEAIDKMHEGEDLEVRVLGVGDAMKIVKVDIGRF